MIFFGLDNSIVVDLIEWGKECFSFSKAILSNLTEDIAQMDPNMRIEQRELYTNAVKFILLLNLFLDLSTNISCRF